VVAVLLGYICHRPGCVDESDITDCEFYNPVVLDNSGLASHLKYCVVVVPSISPDILVRALEAMSVATKVHCPESADASDTGSARKSLGFDPARRVPATDRADHISPRFEIQVWGAEKIAARMHHRLYQVRSNSEKPLKVRAQGKKFFFYTSVTDMSSLQILPSGETYSG